MSKELNKKNDLEGKTHPKKESNNILSENNPLRVKLFGTVKFYDSEKGFGFIKPEDSSDKEIFVASGYTNAFKKAIVEEIEFPEVHISTKNIAHSEIAFKESIPPLKALFAKEGKLAEQMNRVRLSTIFTPPPLRTKCLITIVHPKTIVAEVLIDEKKGITQIRKFDKVPLIGVLELKAGTLFNLDIETMPGKRIFSYSKGNPSDIELFKEKTVDATKLINTLKDNPIYQRANIADDGSDL
jgi:hypothetical protein